MEISSLQICFFWYNKSVANQWARSSDGSASGPVICPTFRGRNSDGCHPVHICKFLFVLITTKISYGRLAQLGERSVRNAEVVGSIPIPSTTSEQASYRLLRLFSKIRAHSFCCSSFPHENTSCFRGGPILPNLQTASFLSWYYSMEPTTAEAAVGFL